MTVALMALVNDLDLPPTPGVSTRACRAVLRSMARIAGDSGEFRYGMRVSKLAALAEYAPATVKRAQRFLVEHGLLERVNVGGGRSSTRWRIVVDRLRPSARPPRAGSRDDTSRLLGRRELGQDRAPRLSAEISSAPAEVVTEICKHGHRAGLMPNRRLPWCPTCRWRIRRRL